MTIEAARDEEIRQREPERGLLPGAGVEGQEGRGLHVGTEPDVREDGEEDVEGGGDALEGVRGAHGVPRLAHLGDEHEEHEVAGEGEDGVGDAEEGGVEVGALGRDELTVGGGVDAGGDDGDEAGDEDGEDGEEGGGVEVAEGAREGDEEGRGCEDAGVGD